MARQLPTGQVYGVAGGSLTNARWAANEAVAKAGQDGEQRTASLLNKFAALPGGPTVMHDLTIRDGRYTYNIDHLVIVGRTVFIIDSKVWAPGFYWTLGGTTRRGFETFAPADKKTMAMAHRYVSELLSSRGVKATVVTPTLLVWPSSSRKPFRKSFLRVPGARVMLPAQFSKLSNQFKAKRNGTVAAEPAIVAALAPLTAPAPARRKNVDNWAL